MRKNTSVKHCKQSPDKASDGSIQCRAGLLLLFLLGVMGWFAFPQLVFSKAQTLSKTTKQLVNPELPTLEKKIVSQGTVYTMTVPANANWKVVPAVSKTLARIDSPLWQGLAVGSTPSTKPIFMMNGGFFDPSNALTTSFIFQGGVLTADPRTNPQLIGNPKLAPYLPMIFNRPELRLYLCQLPSGSFETRYDITPRKAVIPEGCLLQSSLGAGPTLLPQLQDQAEGFVDYDAAGKRTRDPIGVYAPNARSAVGINENGELILMMVAQDAEKPQSSGMSLPDLAELLKAKGAVKAMALDGGSSSSLWYKDGAIFGKVNKDGQLVKRPVKSILMVLPR